jgi:hypothetical protein
MKILPYEFPYTDLDSIKCPSSPRRLLGDKHCSDEKSDDPRSRDKKKKGPDRREQDAASDE